MYLYKAKYFRVGRRAILVESIFSTHQFMFGCIYGCLIGLEMNFGFFVLRLKVTRFKNKEITKIYIDNQYKYAEELKLIS